MNRASEIYGVVGRLDTPLPGLNLRVGVYGHFAPLCWSQVFGGPNPCLDHHESRTNHNKEET